MNPYIFPITCSVCGGEGMMHTRDIGISWCCEFRHSDPAICAENLRRERAKIEKMKKEFTKENVTN